MDAKPNPLLKKRRVTDKSLPNAILSNPDFGADSAMYTSLTDMERRLDWSITRKRVEIQDAMTKIPSTTRVLRIFVSHTVSGQAWQSTNSTAGEGDDKVNFETGQGIPAWQLKLDGRLLEAHHARSRQPVTPRKFSTFIKRMAIELQRDPALYPDGNIIEWPRSGTSENPHLDGFTVRRTGDQPTNIRIVMYLEHYPEQFKVQAELANVLGVSQASRMDVIKALWDYIRIHNLQEKMDRRTVRLDEPLRFLFQAEAIHFHQLANYVNRFLSPPDPIVINYHIDPNAPAPEKPQAYDVQIQMEDVHLRQKIASFIQPSRETLQQIVKLDEEIATLAQSLHNSELKRSFLSSFADDPAKFIQTWLESQSKDLETVLGSGPSDGLTVRQEELRRSEFFKMDWVEEGASVYNGQRMKKILEDQMRMGDKGNEHMGNAYGAIPPSMPGARHHGY